MSNRFRPALLGGLFIGVLSSLPVVNLANCCCLWVIAGGVLTVYLQQKDLPTALETSEAALGGLIAGAIGAAISFLIESAMWAVMGSTIQFWMNRVVEAQPDMPPQIRDWMTSTQAMQMLRAVRLFLTVPLYAVFSMLGALLGLAIFRKKLPPAMPMTPPPTPV